MCAKILTAPSGETGVYYDENGRPMQASVRVRDPKFAERVVAEARAFLAAIPTLRSRSSTPQWRGFSMYAVASIPAQTVAYRPSSTQYRFGDRP